ncbi:MAG: phosphoglycerate kinase [Bacteroidales bacterium]|jgi:phosphoglycerate kinase|nr:phosphoglycerate kinase [Bacteroidales bacterium]MCK9499254.1 phosphoglycerate kinase [Bacteroidales bacterium]MDY0314540.1 phosphoglycerate kinase [Bacteroidales bacterium]NLB85779.1 phosphoglycerate kinase [Bacteroidales bacterium]
MKNNLPLLQDADLKGKIVLVRVDHNVVKSGLIHDPYRIDSTFGTISYILANGGKPILMTHVGRPKDKATNNIIINEKTSVQPIVNYLKEKLQLRIEVPEFCQYENQGYLSIDTSINHLIKKLENNKIDMIYLPNTRWFLGEEAKGENQDRFAYQLAGLADIYVNDAFGSWQAHASTVGVNKFLPSYAGFLMQKEIQNLEKLFNAEKPLLAVVAGSKFDTKINSLSALIKRADKLIIGGVLYNAYLCAKYDITIKGIDEEDIKLAKEFYEFSKQYPNKIVELPYIIESETIEGKYDGKFKTIDIRELKAKTKLGFVLDAAQESFKEKEVENAFMQAKTIFVNAVMGFTPHFNDGTIAMDSLIDKNKEALKLYGGGDTLQELKQLLPGIYLSALDNPKYYMFTGGGAVLKAIEEETPNGIPPIQELLKI